MKKRIGFVSNSSSSSFIIISKEKHKTVELDVGDDGTLEIGASGEYEFGWQYDRYSDFYSKLNFAWIQATYFSRDSENGGDDTWLQMIRDVLKENGVKKLHILLSTDYPAKFQAHIDHASSQREEQNCEMFESPRALETFLLNPLSYIQCQNDN